ncbi:class I SAM-dependent methyltransferase [Algihabitans albus]|uniref:class I SAM-dependent methyltransferase n=1 Tax=Algihabitans albus TaxID=2164067 RepID=UPI000E5D97C8|nr:class I SAM-dependent methyltransferase [Algihabitans albus]
MAKNQVQSEEEWRRWQEQAPRIYDRIYYESNPVVAAVNNAGHSQIERSFSPESHFARVIEVGAGSGHHLDSVRHRFDSYWLTDINEGLLARAAQRHAGKAGVTCAIADATRLPFPDDHFNRLISVYNLEHLPAPHAVLDEWARVVRPGGVLSISIPTEGGIAWNLGRWLTTRRSFRKEGLNLDYIIAREHINACYRLVALIRFLFPQRQEHWFPLRLPFADINLVYTVNVRL